MQACSKITGILPGSPPEGQNWSSTRHLRFAPKTIQCEVEGETIAHQCPLLLFTDKQRSRATKLGFATEDFMPAIPHAMVYVLQQRFLHWVGQKRNAWLLTTYSSSRGILAFSPSTCLFNAFSESSRLQ